MEGPTPVSALIHAATMVTAGVYLVARCTPLFVLAPDAQLVVACIGGFTALLAALIALTQTDLKRVLAYSTLSQLGYMFLALGCGVAGGEHTLVDLRGDRGHVPPVHARLLQGPAVPRGRQRHARDGQRHRHAPLQRPAQGAADDALDVPCGALALAGLPPFSGFWSKDEILGAAFDAGAARRRYGGVYFVAVPRGMVTAFLTAFYTFRAYFLTFWGEERIPEEAGGHAHESPPVMTVPLMILAVFAAGVGAVLALPPWHLFGDFLMRTPGLVEAPERAHGLLA